tara:strand:+ start:733 stop:1464 length:732 start_codon:yes stop_codon:yes gene_type:complete
MRLLLFSFFLVLVFPQNIIPQKNTPEYFLGINRKQKELKQLDTLTFKIDWVDSLSLILPCEGVPVPKKTSRLPNAPRDYRNGTHRGIDFFANWGTPVRSVADAYVIRADHNYIEVPADFRVNLLSATTKVGATPSDIFNSILLGKAVFLDHGFNLVPGFRVISIYAHLSSIEDSISPGKFIKAGQLIGKSGNTGTKESTLGTKKESHLHWEMILQKDEEEIYLGKDISNPLLYETLKRIFLEK